MRPSRFEGVIIIICYGYFTVSTMLLLLWELFFVCKREFCINSFLFLYHLCIPDSVYNCKAYVFLGFIHFKIHFWLNYKLVNICYYLVVPIDFEMYDTLKFEQQFKGAQQKVIL